MLVLPGCGKKTLPVPPQTVVPAPIQEIQTVLDEKGATLFWTRPDKAENGEKIKRLEGFEILRAEIGPDGCLDCPVRYALHDEIELAPAEAKKKRISYTDSALAPNRHYFYKVRSRVGWRLVSDDSKPVSFEWQIPLAPPRNVTVEPGDHALHLNWQASVYQIDGAVFAGPHGYAVYRSEDGEQYGKIAETEATALTDLETRNDRTYYYKLRTFRMAGREKISGPFTEAVAGKPQDLTAPPPPPNTGLVKTADGVKIYWDLVGQEDLAGYRVYRRSQDGAPELIGEVKAPSLSFLDKTPLSEGKPWFYSVTAIDQAQPPNESAFSAEAVLTGGRRK